LLILVAGAASAGLPAPAREDDGEESGPSALEQEGSPREHRRYFEEKYGKPSGAALIRLKQAIAKERDKVGPATPVPDPAAGPEAFARVPGNAWVNLGPTGSSKDTSVIGAGRLTTQSALINAIVTHPTNPDILYVADEGGGVWKTYDATAATPHWLPLTDTLGGTFSGALAMDPYSPEILYLGLGSYNRGEPGITYTRDGGATWADLTFLTAPSGTSTATALWVHDIKIDPKNSSNVLAATDIGLYRSTNAGVSWARVAPPHTEVSTNLDQAWSIAWIGGSSWLVTATTGLTDATTGALTALPGDLGLWRSDDGAVTWTLVTTAVPGKGLGRATLAVAPSTLGDPKTTRIYLAAGNNDETTDSQRDVFRSDDGGKSFVGLGVNSSGAPVNPAAPAGWPSGFQQGDLDFFKSQATYNQALVVDPRDPDTLFIGGQLAHGRSTDGGLTWAVMSHGYPVVPTGLPYVHPDFHAMAISTAGGTARLWIGTDGGLTRSTDAFTAAPGNGTYDDGVNVGRVTILPYALACAPESWPADGQGYMLMGLQDNGTRARVGNSTLWDPIVGGDGVGVAVSKAYTQTPDGIVPKIQLASNFNNITRSDNGGAFRVFTDGIASAGPISLPVFAVDLAAADPTTFLTMSNAPDSAVYRSVAGGAWQKIVGKVTAADGTTRLVLAPPGSSLGLRTLTAYPKQTGVYAAASNRYTFITTDGGANWFNGNYVGTDPVVAPIGTYRLSSITFDPSDSTFSTIIVSTTAVEMFDTQPIPDSYGHVFKSTDKGLHWTSIVGVAGSRLPNLPVSTVLADPGDATGKTIYAGTDAGLYRTLDGGQHWARFGTGLPLTEVTGMCLSESSSSLKVATWGRGIWQLNVGASGNSAGVRGRGDLNHHLRLDGFDLIDLAALLGTTQASDSYRAEADLVGTVNAVDDDDLSAFLTRFGGTP
jgi:hypothetical protein